MDRNDEGLRISEERNGRMVLKQGWAQNVCAFVQLHGCVVANDGCIRSHCCKDNLTVGNPGKGLYQRPPENLLHHGRLVGGTSLNMDEKGEPKPTR